MARINLIDHDNLFDYEKIIKPRQRCKNYVTKNTFPDPKLYLFCEEYQSHIYLHTQKVRNCHSLAYRFAVSNLMSFNRYFPEKYMS